MPDVVYVWCTSLVLGVFLLYLGASYVLHKIDDNSDDDLGYLELLWEGGSPDE